MKIRFTQNCLIETRVYAAPGETRIERRAFEAGQLVPVRSVTQWELPPDAAKADRLAQPYMIVLDQPVAHPDFLPRVCSELFEVVR